MKEGCSCDVTMPLAASGFSTLMLLTVVDLLESDKRGGCTRSPSYNNIVTKTHFSG